MSTIDDWSCLDGILYDLLRQLNTTSVQTCYSIVHRLEANVEFVADYIRDIDAQDLTLSRMLVSVINVVNFRLLLFTFWSCGKQSYYS